ncbi:MAG TPA: type II secretion system protein [Gemmatimonadaceae bacterium]|nr:type II secretion system protein [Gemmatimonadaceae bacterium]
MRWRADARRRGVSLFEAVAAMAMVGIVAVAALEAVGSGMRTAARARRIVEASALAESRLDWLDFMNATAMQALPDSVKRGTFDPPLDDYAWTTDAVPVSTQPGLYDVTVRVSWAPDGAFALRSYVYRRPVITTGAAGGRGGRGGGR